MNREHILGLTGLTDHQRTSLLELVDAGIRDPCLQGVTPALCKLWYRHIPCSKARGKAIADLRDLILKNGAHHSRVVASKLAAASTYGSLNTFLTEWMSITTNLPFLEAVAWSWLEVAGHFQNESEDDRVLTISPEMAAQDPLSMVDVLANFKTAFKLSAFKPLEIVDHVALSNGWWDKDSMTRKTAFVLSRVREETREHEWIPHDPLLTGFPFEDVQVVIDNLIEEGRLVFLSGCSGITLEHIRFTSSTVKDMAEQYKTPLTPWSGVQPPPGLQPEQVSLFSRVAGGERLTLCCAPAGTGKTFSASALALASPGTVLCLAPTWKAINVLRKKITRQDTLFQTIQGFTVAPPPSYISLVIVDETSMLTMGQIKQVLMRFVLDATRILFLGDDAQLPCIGRGFPIKDIQSVIYTCRLTTCMRAEGLALVVAAQQVRTGESIVEVDKEVMLVASTNAEECTMSYPAVIVPPWESGYVQIITPQNNHVKLINETIQAKLTGNGQIFSSCYIGDPVRFMENTAKYKNGDEGMLVEVEYGDVGAGEKRGRTKTLKGKVQLQDGTVVEVTEGHIQPAYTATVHKVQGSEYDSVVLALFRDVHPNLMIREMVYTAVTRAKKTLTIFGMLTKLDDCKPLSRRTVFAFV